MIVKLAFAATVLMIVAHQTRAADWPQWQGPNRDAISQETGLLQVWPEEGPPLAWRIGGLGGGYSAASIADGRIYGMSNRDGDEVVWALSEADGSEIWVKPLGTAYTEGMRQGSEGTGCTPTVDGDRLYVLGAGGTLACLSVQDGEIIWQHSLPSDLGGVIPTWRYNESPLIDGEKLICTPGGADATLVALDKMTGETIWTSQVPDRTRTDDPDDRGDGGRGRRGSGRRRGGFGRGPSSGAGYASAIAIDFDGVRQYVQLTAKGLVGVSASDGKLLWRFDPVAANISCSTPIYHDGLVFASSAYEGVGGAVKLTKDAGGEVTAQEIYTTNEMKNHHGGMVVTGGCLYGATGGNSGGFLACLDFQTGEVLWTDRRAPKGSVALADGRLYLRAEDGTMLLVEPNREEYVERGRFDQPDRSESPAWTHPVIANGKLYIRDQDALLCYDVKAK